FLFVSTAVISLGLLAGPELARATRTAGRATVLGYAAFAVAVWLATGWLRPLDIEPHWTVPDDEAPFWPTPAFLAVYAGWLGLLSTPVLAIPAVLLERGRRGHAWLASALATSLSLGLGMSAVTMLKRDHDLRELALLYAPGQARLAQLSGSTVEVRVLAPD